MNFLQRIQEGQQVGRVGRIQSLIVCNNLGRLSAVPQNCGSKGGRPVVVHQAAGLGKCIGETPQGRGSPHGERCQTGVIGLERDSTGVSRSHIVEQEIRVRIERDVAEGINCARLSPGSSLQRNVGLGGKTLDMANTAADAVEHSEPSLCR